MHHFSLKKIKPKYIKYTKAMLIIGFFRPAIFAVLIFGRRPGRQSGRPSRRSCSRFKKFLAASMAVCTVPNTKKLKRIFIIKLVLPLKSLNNFEKKKRQIRFRKVTSFKISTAANSLTGSLHNNREAELFMRGSIEELLLT
ncbi:hypothetical protein BpHYR1_010027 [Brachionus plicatilis]|uniref:Uncharacterized protein n=1 Tax=Brachionus plicatilis TaxID=10195 RepID=A0A3M7QFJ4_BRAPC|nr:hypothetical protein BpHYR1_010027 [Brachionus plicatilis]